MSIQVDQSIRNTMVHTNIRPKLGLRLANLAGRVDFDTAFGIATIAIIWGGFFVAFTSM